ncbi:MAG TPA: glycosyltransferase family A protein [Bryobacteraceae bacterium]|nr:glycosyltransferase family A protein [Bryobacteraceae bacterium]
MEGYPLLIQPYFSHIAGLQSRTKKCQNRPLGSPPPKVSVVIPCFNLGHYLDEAVDSVLNQTFQDLEIVIVNDGSTDPATNIKLAGYDKPRTRVIQTQNQGLAAARNVAIAHSRGDYILPLDADDRLAPTFLEKTVPVLNLHLDIGIVYSEVEWFGAKSGKWDLPPYKFPDILLNNVIVATALFRRSDWELVGGYSTEFRSRWEDYDFWLSLIERGRIPHRVSEVLFYYRQRPGSMIAVAQKTDDVDLYDLLFRRHQELYLRNIKHLFGRLIALDDEASQRRHEALQLQVFVPRDGGYSEAHSLRQTLRAGIWENIDIALPEPWRGRLRIDPANLAGEIEIRDLCVGRGEIGVLPKSQPGLVKVRGTALLTEAEGNKLSVVAWGSDPQIYLPEFTADGPLRLSMKIRASPYDTETAASVSFLARLWEKMHPAASIDSEDAVCLQVFLPDGHIYSEEHSVKVEVERDIWRIIRMELPAGWHGVLRLDPANARCSVEIDWLRLEAGGQTFWDLASQADSVRVEGTAMALSPRRPLQIVAWGDDPQIYLPVGGFVPRDQESMLTIRLRVTHCGTELAMQAESLTLLKRQGWRGISAKLRALGVAIATAFRR